MKKYGYSIKKLKAAAETYVYKRVDGEELLAYVHLPEKAESSLPVVINFHGGGWIGSSPEGVYSMLGGTVKRLNQSGIAFVNVQYRLGSEKNRYPKLVLDCMDAVAWVASDPEKIGFDRERMAAMGVSAGGHLALLAALGQSGFPVAGRAPYHVRAVVDVCGPTDLCFYTPDRLNQDIRYVLNIVFGGTYEQLPELYRQFSPIYYMDSVDHPPALLIIHGDRDSLVPIEQSYLLYEEAKKRGWDVYLHILKNANHAFLPENAKRTIPCFSSIFTTTEEFLKKHLCSASLT